MPHNHSHSVPRGIISLRPVSRASNSRMRHAIAYRSASAVNTGAFASTDETATLPPTQIMAPDPAATPPQVPPPGLAATPAAATLAPGMRLGWLIPPRRLLEDLVEAKHAADLGSPALPQLVLAHLIATGELEHHIRQVRKRQRTRRDALLGALREYLPGARVQGVAAGLHLLITFPELTGQVEDTDLAERIHRAGVLVHPLSWHRQRPGPPGLVLGYAAHPPDQLHEAAQRIARIPGTGAPGTGARQPEPRQPEPMNRHPGSRHPRSRSPMNRHPGSRHHRDP